MTLSTRTNQFILGLGLLLSAWVGIPHAEANPFFQQRPATEKATQDTTKNKVYKPTRRPTYRQNDRYGDPFSNSTGESPLFLKDPGKMKLDVDIDTALNYTIYEKIGDLNYRPTSTMSFEEFKKQQEREQLKQYFQSKSRAADGESAISGKGFTPKIFVSPVLDRIFGGSYVELVPRGFVTLDLGAAFNKTSNPLTPARQQRNGGFVFDQQINMSVVGKVGEKLSVTANFDNNNSFDFQNNMKVEYTGFKEDILQKLEIGNVSLPLNNTLIQGAQNLFGVKAQMQFGRLNVTSIASTQRGKVSSIDIGGNGTSGPSGGQGRPFEIIASNYDDNRHFFLGHFFRDNYRKWISNLPQITSGVNITRVEVYIVTRNSETQTLRNVVGLMDLGEGKRIYNGNVRSNGSTSPAGNDANRLYRDVLAKAPLSPSANRNADEINNVLEQQLYGANNFKNGTDYEKITASRKLAVTEYTFHQQLGYVTLSRKLQSDEAIAVAYEYTYNGKSYKVGELSEDYASLKDDEVIFLKLLRPRKVSIRDENQRPIPTWDLMMKNIYSFGITQLSRDGFQLRVIYRDDRSGIDNPQLQEGQSKPDGTGVRDRQLVEIMGLDRLNPVNDPQPDGNFDYVEGITINSQAGLIIFPYLEPFNQALREVFKGDGQENYLIKKYVYDTLYRSTKADAEQFATKNKFYLTGLYSAGSSKEISIPGFGVSQGSVKVFAGGIALNEGTDYTVDYTFGKVIILNEGILSSGKNISVQFEQSDPFSFQTRSLLGTRFDYKLSDEVNLGSTLLYYNERPLVSRNAIGTEPARNLQYGVDFNVNKNSRVLTKIVDAIPFLQTKEVSTINLNGEFAQLIPGTSNVIDGEGTGYIDDFENTATPYSLLNPNAWKLASIPEDIAFDPTVGAQNDISAGHKRAKLAWYTIDPLFYRSTGARSIRPDVPDAETVDNHYTRQVGPQEIFKNKNRTQGNFFETVFDIAYYPEERGPYNYNKSFTPGAENWAGITTAVKTEVDFDKANIEYVEFWLMNPFKGSQYGRIGSGTGADNTDGKLIFQLGNISEDVARDGKHAFENGLPANDNSATVTENNWGKVTTEQYVTPAFANETAARERQDVGLDGLSNDEEAEKFGTFSDADPSADDFKHYLAGEFDQSKAGILERYKNFNGQDRNSPIGSASDRVSYAGSNTPDNEDLNADNTLSEEEEYYQYEVPLVQNQLAIGKKYIVDMVTTNGNGDTPLKESIEWYLFRIPVREFDSQHGGITGFKSIKYARMIVTGWKKPVVLRMANFRMVGSKWRKHLGQIRDDGLITTEEPAQDDFTLSVVNLEENSQPDPNGVKSPYTIPPGVVRDRDNTSTVYRQLNEQSVQVCVDNLKDGDARAIYKNVAVDLFNYGRVKMFFHLDSEDASDPGKLNGFLRLGTDFDENFYEIQVPLRSSMVNNSADPNEVWPEENNIDIDLNDLYALKGERDRVGAPLGQFYAKQVGRYVIRVFGRPDLSAVRLMMIGVRNPTSVDQRSFTGCIWANELRVADFNRVAGWAVNTSANLKLADFATISGALRYTTFGFGSVSSKIGERTRDESTRYDVSANVNLDKLLPGNTGIKLPMFVSYDNTISNPNYDPANPDMKLAAALKSFATDEQRQNFKEIIQDRTVRRSLNFTNVRKVKVKPDAKTHIYDIENLSFSYAYSDALQTNYFIKEALQQQYRGSVAYNFAPKATGFEPFKTMKAFNSPWLKMIKDFNFSLMPSNLSVRGDLDRSFNKKIYRNAPLTPGGAFTESKPNYLKYFTFNRTYNLRWNFSKSLSAEYNALANAIIDEPVGEINTKENQDAVIKNLKNLGRMKNFDQTATLNYILPLDKLPITDFLGAEYRYQAKYNWRAGPLNLLADDDSKRSLDFGNIIQNTRDNNVTGKIDLIRLYNKVKFLKELNAPPKPIRPLKPGEKAKPLPVDTVKSMPGLVKGFLRLLMSVRSINASYTLSEGTILPGFNPTPKYFGMDEQFNTPGFGFILGSQDPSIRHRAARNGWLTEANELTTPFTQFQNKILDIKANVDLSPDLKVQLNLRKENSSSYQEIFRYDTLTGGWASLSPNRSGSYKISYITIQTSFEKSNRDIDSKLFHEFEKNLVIMRSRFNKLPGISNEEYDTTSQDVTVAAFLATYTGKDANTSKLNSFPKIPLPNWRLDYTGLSKLEMFKNTFQSVTISHAYSSSYSVSNYSNSLQYSDPEQIGINVPIEDYNGNFYGSVIDGKYVPLYILGQVFLSEQFSPLIGVNIRTKSRLTANFQYKTKRDLALNISNAQITEVNNKDVSFELGYTKNNMKLPFKVEGETVVLKNDVTFRLNVTVSDNITVQRKVEEVNTITSGNVNFQLRPNISYVVNQKLNIQAYFERTINEPKVSNSFRRATTRFGVQIRFSLAQ